ncbi:protein 13M [Wood mouse herpesvirus]|uniref:Protein 13M n=1 Tax=Wood mouse herpesvirus TaxID=432370 RepID=D0U1K5_9GAMA|nr:protein 13M [Wood mouse herpesvirus]ACY41152.1 protein 13M [Wood mouse herpesvirus]
MRSLLALCSNPGWRDRLWKTFLRILLLSMRECSKGGEEAVDGACHGNKSSKGKRDKSAPKPRRRKCGGKPQVPDLRKVKTE